MGGNTGGTKKKARLSCWLRRAFERLHAWRRRACEITRLYRLRTREYGRFAKLRIREKLRTHELAHPHRSLARGFAKVTRDAFYRSLFEHSSKMPATSEQKMRVHTSKATVLALVPL